MPTKISFYVKLQDAYIAENGDYMGTFKQIGYEMDKTTNFEYTTAITSSDNGKVALASTENAWKATSQTALNECKKSSTWSLKIAQSSTGNGAAWTASMSDLTNCEALTPRFLDLTRGMAAGN